MFPSPPGVNDEPPASRAKGPALSGRARLAILLIGAAVAIASVLAAAGALQILERGGEVDDEEAEWAPLDEHDGPLTSLTNSFPALEDSSSPGSYDVLDSRRDREADTGAE